MSVLRKTSRIQQRPDEKQIENELPHKSRVSMRGKGRMEKFIAFFLALAVLVMLPGFHADAAETVRNGTQTAEQVEILVEGSLEQLDRQAVLDRLNEIREEACREGVSNPSNGEPMGPEDYVPLQWSSELEKIAILRAAESTILQDHRRPDGSDCFTAAPDGVPYTMETLAWGFGSAEAAVEGWYSEKTAYVEASGTPAGHYIALINPENRFVGIAELRADWQRDACAGAFASHEGTGNTGSNETGDAFDAPCEAGEVQVWSIPLLRSYLPAVIEKAVSVTAVRICNAARFGK